MDNDLSPALPKQLVLFWKWQHLTSAHTQTECLLVEGHDNTHVYLLHEDMGTSNLAAWIDANVSATTDCLVLLHNTKMPVQELQPLKEKYRNCPNIRFERFGGGATYLYFKPDSDTGLINQNGSWASKGLFSTADGRDVTPVLFNISGALRIHYFNPVWRYYRHHFKRRLYERKVLLLRALLALAGAGNPITPALILGLDPKMQAEFNDLFCLSREVYPDNRALGEAMDTLERSFAQETALHRLNQLFQAALNALPESIY